MIVLRSTLLSGMITILIVREYLLLESVYIISLILRVAGLDFRLFSFAENCIEGRTVVVSNRVLHVV